MQFMDAVTSFMIRVAWWGMLAGVVSGALIGLFFHREDWMGGYASYRRRLTRLGHISFFGLGIVNFLFAFTHHLAGLPSGLAWTAGTGFVVGAVTMPACCFLTAWRKEPWRQFFFVPVGGVLFGIVTTLWGLSGRG